MNWNNVTLRQQIQIQQIKDLDDDSKLRELMIILYGEDVENLPIAEYTKKAKEIDLSGEIPHTHVKSKYVINGRTYNFDVEGVPTAGQFFDYQNYCKEQNNYADKLSVFLIPEGHKYGDGYDIKQVKEDMLDLPVIDANALGFFFQAELIVLLDIFRHSLIQSIRKEKMPYQKKREKIKLIKTTYDNLESLVTYLNTLK